MSEANIITGQYVQISQSPASLGERIMAQVIDSVLIIFYVIGISILIVETKVDFFADTSSSRSLYTYQHFSIRS